jgi:hypothetical protein
MHNTKGIHRTSTPLFKIITDGMGPKNKTGLATVSSHVLQ